jgi:hypothetical protein
MDEIEIPFVQIVHNELGNIISNLMICGPSTFKDEQEVIVTYWMKLNGGRWEYKEHKMRWDMVKLLYGKG